jgi:hypothetical protein
MLQQLQNCGEWQAQQLLLQLLICPHLFKITQLLLQALHCQLLHCLELRLL